jgi:GPI mannosyltransferase 1 subunit M
MEGSDSSYLVQGIWLHQGFRLEFLGISSFFPGLWLASLGFFAVNVWILGIIVSDVASLQLPASDGTANKASE